MNKSNQNRIVCASLRFGTGRVPSGPALSGLLGRIFGRIPGGGPIWPGGPEIGEPLKQYDTLKNYKNI